MFQLKKTIRGIAIVAVLCGLMMVTAAATEGTVTADTLRLRSEASTSSTILTSVSKGAVVEVTGSAVDGWYPVSYLTYTGYMSAEYLTVYDATYGQVTTSGSSLNVRSGADTSYGKVSTLADGAVVTILDTVGDWYQISYNSITGYVYSQYITIVDSSVAAAVATSSSAVGDQVVSYALSYLGCPYVYGAAGTSSFDCSGLTSYIYNTLLGYSINRTASAQATNGVYVAKADLQPGDLVFFATGSSSTAVTHVGIYIGDGQFVHASSTGSCVRIDDLSSGYYSTRYLSARRIA